jgi:hypothetical protein
MRQRFANSEPQQHYTALEAFVPAMLRIIGEKGYMNKLVTVGRLYAVAAELGEYVMAAQPDYWPAELVAEYKTVAFDPAAVFGNRSDAVILRLYAGLDIETVELFEKRTLTFRTLLTTCPDSMLFP